MSLLPRMVAHSLNWLQLQKFYQCNSEGLHRRPCQSTLGFFSLYHTSPSSNVNPSLVNLIDYKETSRRRYERKVKTWHKAMYVYLLKMVQIYETCVHVAASLSNGKSWEEDHIYLIEKILNKKKAYSFHFSWKYRNKKFLIICRHAPNKGRV